MPSKPEDIRRVVQSFNQNAIAARKELAGIYDEDRRGFLEKCRPALQDDMESPGGHFLVAFLLGHGLLEQPVCDSLFIPADRAAALLRIAKRVDPGFEVRLLRTLNDGAQNPYALARLLEVLALASQSTRLVPFLTQMMGHRHPFVQSKATILMGKLNQNAEWVRQRLNDADARVRANAVESLWGESSDDSKAVFRQGAANDSGRVAANSLVGLYLAGEPEALRRMKDMAASSSPAAQVAAIWAMGAVGDPRLLPFLAEAMGKCDESLRARVFDAIRKIRHRRDQVSSFGSLRVYLTSSVRLEGGRRRIRFSAFDPVRREVIDGDRLRATHVIVSEDEITAFHYSLRPNPVLSKISVHVVLPAPASAGCGFGVAAGQVFRDLRAIGRVADDWDASFYRQEKIEPAPLDGQLCPDPGAALEAASAKLAAADGAKHLILGADPDAPLNLARLSARLDRAKHDSLTIHTILPESAPAATLLQVEALARETGGFALRFAGIDSFARHAELILTSLLGTFDVEYEMPASDDSGFAEVRVQIFSPQGMGEAAGFIKPVELAQQTEPALSEA